MNPRWKRALYRSYDEYHHRWIVLFDIIQQSQGYDEWWDRVALWQSDNCSGKRMKDYDMNNNFAWFLSEDDALMCYLAFV